VQAVAEVKRPARVQGGQQASMALPNQSTANARRRSNVRQNLCRQKAAE